LHPRRRGAQRLRHLPAAAQGGRDRAADDAVRHGVRAARDRRHARREPAAREGAQDGVGAVARVIGRLAVVGVGLLGGAVALAARANGVAREIVGVGRDRQRLEGPLRAGLVDRIATDVAAGVDGADCVVLAATVSANERLPETIWPSVPAGALVTDVGSTKRGIVAVAERLGAGRPLGFVGSHPMAGSEKSGWQVARADLFRGATVIVAPSDATPPRPIQTIHTPPHAPSAPTSTP